MNVMLFFIFYFLIFYFMSASIYRQLQWETEILWIYQLQKSPEIMKSGSSVKHLNQAGWIQPQVIHADMTAKPGLETASQLPAHHCNDLSLAEHSLHQEPTHQVFSTPPNHCHTQIHNSLCTSPPMGSLLRVLPTNLIQNWFQIHSRKIRGWEPLNHGHHHVRMHGLTPLWTVQLHSAYRQGYSQQTRAYLSAHSMW